VKRVSNGVQRAGALALFFAYGNRSSKNGLPTIRQRTKILKLSNVILALAKTDEFNSKTKMNMNYFLDEPPTSLPYNFVLIEKRDGSIEKKYLDGRIIDSYHIEGRSLNPSISEKIDRIVKEELERRPDAFRATLYNVEHVSEKPRPVRTIMAQ